MKNKRILIIGLTVLLIILVVIAVVLKLNKKEKSIEDMTVEEKVDYYMDKMTIDEKIAQMLILYYTNDTVDDNLKGIIENHNPGGFIITKDNITTYENTKKFISDLKAASEIPLIISIDQEGGNVQRLQGITDTEVLNIPYMYNLGSTNEEDLAYQVGKVMAEQLKTIGVNVVYAPVVDIYSNPSNSVIGERSFGTNKETVSLMSIALAKGLEDNGIVATYKHFPGHGDTDIDSHANLPIINKTLDELYDLELVPFKEAIKNNAKLIMIGHLSLPDIVGDNTPASLSSKIVTDLLKNDLGYDGLVITDALNMGALTNDYSYEEIYTKAIEAGCDLLLMPNGSSNAITYIKKNISEERINESVRKILTFKFTYLKDYDLLDKSYLNNSSQQEIISRIPE